LVCAYHTAKEKRNLGKKVRQLESKNAELREASKTIISEVRAIVDGEFGGDWAEQFNLLYDLFSDIEYKIKKGGE